MKSKRLIVILLALVIIGGGCSGGRTPSDGVQPPEAAALDDSRLKIYTSFYPMYYLAKEIAGDKAEVICLIPAGAEPHDWEPTPRTIVELQGADLFIYNGIGMEAWVSKIIANLDPARFKLEAANILEAVIEKDRQNEEYYRSNYRSLEEKLDKLDSDIRAAVKGFKSNVIVVSHEAFGYLAKDYGLQQIAIRGINPEEEPSPAQMARLVEECREHGVKYIFFEKLVSSKLSEKLAGEVGARTLVLNDAAGLTSEDLNSGKDYISVMYENLDNLKKALSE